MKINLTRMAGLVLAFGFFFGCKSASDLSDTRTLYENRQLDMAAESAARAVRQDPGNADAHYLHGQILLDMALLAPPGNRRPYYRNASQSLHRAADLFTDTEPEKAAQVNRLLIQHWQSEVDRAGTAFEESTSFHRDELTIPLHHADNAITLIPDSVSSYVIKSDIYYYLGDTGSAVITLEEIPGKNAEIFERIGYYYSLDDRHIEAADAFERAYQMSTGNINLLYGLVNTLVEGGSIDQALSRINELSQTYPENPIFSALEGSLQYEQAENYIMERIDDGSIGYDGAVSEGIAMIDLAETSFRRATDLNNGDPDIHASIGFFYMNSGGLLLDAAEHQNENSRQATEQRVAEFLEKAIPHLHTVATHEQDPAIWLSLHQIYSYLDMPEEAGTALENAGL